MDTGVYNLASENTTISALADQVAGHFSGLTVERTPRPFEDQRNYRVNVNKARVDLSFWNIRSVDEGIREVKQLLDEDRLVFPDSPRYWNDKHLAQGGK